MEQEQLYVDVERKYVAQEDERAHEPPSKKKPYENETKRIVIPPMRQMCQYVLEGKECPFGDKCRMLHDEAEYVKSVEELTIPCHNMLTYGQCKYGTNCLFSHEKKCATIQPIPEMKNIYKQTDVKDIRVRLQNYKREKDSKGYAYETKRDEDSIPLDLSGKLMLAPMCTVGHVAFRRLCISFGCDVTSTELCMAKSFIAGYKGEFIRLKRHPDEKIFGFNISGTAQDLDCAAPFLSGVDCDFFELNACCPDPSILKCKAGAHLLSKQSLFTSSVESIRRIAYNYDHPRPYTIKTLLGMTKGGGKGNVVVPMLRTTLDKLKTEGKQLPSAVTIHGRYAVSRSAKPLDLETMEECRKLVSQYSLKYKDNEPCNPHKMKFVPNGDIYNWEDVEALYKDTPNGVMIGRGALIKPWIFKEIKTKTTLDPSSSERMKYLQLFGGYLLDAFGSDYVGREHARVQFLENYGWMTRYVPTGIMARDSEGNIMHPQKINQKVPRYSGRDEMETLLGSSDVRDWIKVSEHVFGRAKDGFIYYPKYTY